MKFTLLLFILCCFICITYAQNDNPDSDIIIQSCGSAEICNGTRKIIKLEENNFVALRGKIDEESASEFITNIMKIKSDQIYIYLITPGGSVVSGNNIIQIMDTLTSVGKQIICIADHAYSMGFVIFQACPTRYIMEHTIIMQHQMSLTVEGQIEQARNHFKLVEKLERKSEIRQSNRLNITISDFHERIQHDLWLYGDEIIENNAADEVVGVLCNFDTDQTITVKKQVFFGNIDLEFSLCPMVHMPRKITFNVNEDKIEDKLREEYVNFKHV